MAVQIEGWQINDVLRTVRAMTPDGDAQLSIIARALVIGCRSTQVRKETMLAILSAAFDDPTALVPLDATPKN